MIGSSIASSQRLSSSYIINDNNIINEHSGLLTTHDEEEIESGYQGTTHISFDATTGNSLARRPLLIARASCITSTCYYPHHYISLTGWYSVWC